jgi:ABC-2 type transport system permease protein
MTVLTRLDPATYGIDPLRLTVLGAAGVPGHVLDGLGVSLFGNTLAIWTEEALLLAFGFAMLAVAIRSFQHRD